jgi:ribosomal protein S18 acetylase RimI-like enzyme
VRPLRFDDAGPHPDDVATCAALVAAAEVELLGEVASPEGEVREALSLPWTDRNATALVERDGTALATVWVSREGQARQTFFAVHSRPGPARAQVHEYAVAHALDAARSHALQDGAPGWTARSGSWIEDVLHFDTLRAEGLAPVRRFFQMHISADSPLIPAQAPALPAGVEIVVSRDEATYRQLYDVDCAAFADHWNFTVHPFDEWCRELVDAPSRDPEGMWLLVVDGQPAGLCILDDTRLDANEGYVGVLGVLREFRGRGLAALMLQRAFVRDRDRGRSGTRLGVDAENTTGAVGLYEKVGMRAARTREGWALTL